MPNQMKHTECKVCGQNLEDMTYDKMMAHVNKHAAADENQTSMEAF